MLSPQLEQELRDEFARTGRRIQTPDGLTRRLLDHNYRPPGPRRRLFVVSGGLVLLVIIGLIVIPSGPKAGPSVSKSGGPLKEHLALRLVNDQVALVSNEPLGAAGSISAISCSSASDCIGVGTKTQHTAGLVATTTDGGESWKQRALPSDLKNLSAISCVTSDQCVAVGSGSSGAAIVATTNGGTTWISFEVPDGVTLLSSVSCAADRCWAVGAGHNGATMLSGSPNAPWALSSVPNGVTTLSAVGCTADLGTPTCVAVGSANSTPAVIGSISGAPWEHLTTPPGAHSLASVACTGSTAPVCTTLVQEGNYWLEASRFVTSADPAGEWHVPQLASGTSVSSGTVLGGTSTCVAIGGPSCTPSNANLVDTVTSVIASIDGQPSTPGSLNESLTAGYIFSQPSSSEPSSSLGPLSPVWYVGVSDNGLSANEVLTPTERMLS